MLVEASDHLSTCLYGFKKIYLASFLVSKVSSVWNQISYFTVGITSVFADLCLLPGSTLSLLYIMESSVVQQSGPALTWRTQCLYLPLTQRKKKKHKPTNQQNKTKQKGVLPSYRNLKLGSKEHWPIQRGEVIKRLAGTLCS